MKIKKRVSKFYVIAIFSQAQTTWSISYQININSDRILNFLAW